MPPKEINTEPCRVCGVVIRYKGDVPRHEQLHRPNDAVTLYKCPYQGCEYKNLQKSNLNTHIHTHTGEKPHACPDCDYRTADPGSLTRHRKRKHGYVPDCQRPKAKSTGSTKQPVRRNAYNEVLPTSFAPLADDTHPEDMYAGRASTHASFGAHDSFCEHPTRGFFSYTWDKSLFPSEASLRTSNLESIGPFLSHSPCLFPGSGLLHMQAQETGTICPADLQLGIQASFESGILD